MKRNLKISIIVVSIFSTIFSQELFYKDHSGENRKIVSLNLETKEKTIIIPEEMDPFRASFSSNKKMVAFCTSDSLSSTGYSIALAKLENLNVEEIKTIIEYNPQTEFFAYMLDAPQANKVFLFTTGITDTSKIVVVDRNNLSPMDTLEYSGLPDSDNNTNMLPFLSNDQQYILFPLNSRENEIFYKKYDLNSGSVELTSYDLLSDDIVANRPYTAEDGKVLYECGVPNFILKYAVFDAEKEDIIGKPVAISGKYYPKCFLSLDGSKIILDKITKEEDLFFWGDIYVYDVETGHLIRRLRFSPKEGRDSGIRLFESVPDKIYQISDKYYPNPDSICVGDLSYIQSTDSLLSMLKEDVDKYLENGSITDLGVAEELKTNIEQKDMDGFLNIIEEQNGSGISEEVYYSFKMNGNLISERLADEQVNDGLPIKFIDSQGRPIPDGSLKYYISGWQEVENDSSGVFYIDSDKEMIKLRMNYGSANFDTTVINDTTKTIFIQTNQVIVKLQDSENNLIDEGIVKYYASGWREIGTTVAGKVEKELLPNSYKIRVTYNGRNYDLQQDISQNPLVEVQVEE